METDLNKLRDRAYKIEKAHGFHEKEFSNEHWLMLIISEIGEAVNADRKNHHADMLSFNEGMIRSTCIPYIMNATDGGKNICFKRDFETWIKDSVEDELSDVVIRLLDFAGDKGINFEEHDIIGCDNNFCEDDYFCEKCYYLCRLICDNMNYQKLEYKIKVVLADVFQLARRYNIDLFRFIDLKMKYNELRPYKNGKNY